MKKEGCLDEYHTPNVLSYTHWVPDAKNEEYISQNTRPNINTMHKP